MGEDYYKKVFAKNLKRLLFENDKSQVDLIKDLGITRSAISTWVNGTRLPRMDKVDMLAKYFGCTRSDLIEERQTESQTKTNTDSLPDAAAAVLDSVRDAFGDRPAEALDMFTHFNDEGQDKILDHMKDLAEVSRYTEKEDVESRLA